MKKFGWILILIVLMGLSGCNAGTTMILADGRYTVDFETDSSMFRANEACDGKGILTVKDGKAMLHVSLASKNILQLYLGTANDAEKNEADWLQPTMDMVTYEDGMVEEVYGFDIPVSSIEEPFALALIGKKGVWYDHQVCVQNPVIIDEKEDVLTDGIYTCSVTLQGGSGRAFIQSPAKLSVQDGVITAEIVWSSPYYESMVVGDVSYNPILNEVGEIGENAVFQIPIVLDTDFEVQASTVAMSEPHQITYILYFDSTTMQQGV